MDIETLKKIKEAIRTMAVEPPWCENIEQLKVWLKGFETCIEYVNLLIDAQIKQYESHSRCKECGICDSEESAANKEKI